GQLPPVRRAMDLPEVRASLEYPPDPDRAVRGDPPHPDALSPDPDRGQRAVARLRGRVPDRRSAVRGADPRPLPRQPMEHVRAPAAQAPLPRGDREAPQLGDRTGLVPARPGWDPGRPYGRDPTTPSERSGRRSARDARPSR